MLESLVRDYGYLAIFVVTFLEGESIVIVAGLLAHEGLLELPLVILSAFLGSYAGDQFWFYLGRRYGPQLVGRWPAVAWGVNQVMQRLDRYDTLFILSFRFIYGIRNIAPIAIALGGISPRRFAILNGIAAAVWATVFGCGGYFFGTTMDFAFGGLKTTEERIVAVIAIVALMFAIHTIVRHWMRKKKSL